LFIGILCIVIGATVSTLFTTIYDVNHPTYFYFDKKSKVVVYNCIGILNCNMYATPIITEDSEYGTLKINWAKPPEKNGLSMIPHKGHAYSILKKWSGINIPNLIVHMSSMYIMDYHNAQLKNVYILFIKNIGTFASLYDSFAIQIVMCWNGIDSSVNSSHSGDVFKTSELLIIDNDKLQVLNHGNKGVVGNFIRLSQTGGSRRGTKKSQK
jgi:hypothetical protein